MDTQEWPTCTLTGGSIYCSVEVRGRQRMCVRDSKREREQGEWENGGEREERRRVWGGKEGVSDQ